MKLLSLFLLAVGASYALFGLLGCAALALSVLAGLVKGR